jgi:branched-chain amino acid transport system ATP-binding protein
MLKVDNLCKNFGGLKAVNQCSFEVQEGMIYGLIGPNGSGKTTTFNLITGFLEPSGDRQDLSARSPLSQHDRYGERIVGFQGPIR